jgi:hypothetical protein
MMTSTFLLGHVSGFVPRKDLLGEFQVFWIVRGAAGSSQLQDNMSISSFQYLLNVMQGGPPELTLPNPRELTVLYHEFECHRLNRAIRQFVT